LIKVPKYKWFIALIGTLSLLSLFVWFGCKDVNIPPIHGQSDVIILLAGGYAEKVDVTAQLFHNGVAGKILLTNDGVKSRWSRLYQRNLYNIEWTEEALIAKGVPRSAIVQLDFKKSGTMFDALAVRDYMVTHRIKSITLVTYDFHTSRAYWAFDKVLHTSGTEIQVHSIATQNRGVLTRFPETMKQAWYLLRYGLMVPSSPSAASKVVAETAEPLSAPSLLTTPYGPLKLFPKDNPWNRDISNYPVHPNSKSFINAIGTDKPIHPDFGTVWEGVAVGIPYVVVNSDQKKVPVHFQYASESDPGPYPIPQDAPVEGGDNAKGDRHVIVIDYHDEKLYELFDAHKDGVGWQAGSGAIFDLTSNKLRPAGWTSADAAGLPIFPGLVRYDEVVQQKEIRHALRFSVVKTQRAYIEPARHSASKNTDKNLPPMGLRLRLRANFDISGYPINIRVILRGMKRYGMILADNGGDFFISGVHDMHWNDEELGTLKRVKGSDLEVVYTGEKEM